MTDQTPLNNIRRLMSRDSPCASCELASDSDSGLIGGSMLLDMLDSVIDGFWIWDLINPSYEYISPGFWKTFGVDPKTMPHSPESWKNMIHPDDLVRAEAAFTAHVSDGSPYNLLVRYKHAIRESWVWIICRGQAQFDDDGRPIAMIGLHQDVTSWADTARETESGSLGEAGDAIRVVMEKLLGIVGQDA